MTPLLARRGAWVAAALLLLGYATVFLAVYLSLAAGGGTDAYQLTWWHLRVPALDRTFGDLRTITHGVECLKRGIDPYVVNPCDPWGRLVNYPPVWLKIFHLLGVGPGATRWLGAAIDIAFVVAALAFLGDRPVWQGLVYGAALISPALMMGIERGNNDYLMFALVVAALVLLLGKGIVRQGSGLALLLLAVIGKLFPILAAAIVLVRRRSLLLPALIVVVLGTAYFLSGQDTLGAIARNTHREVFYSYGAEVFFIGLGKYFGHPELLVWKWPVLGFVSAAALALGLTCRGSFELRDDRWGAGFAVGGAIYLFSFFVASSFDYRLAFLLLALPQLMDWAVDRGNAMQRRLASVSLIAILASLWLSFYSVKLHLIDEVFTWLTFFLLLAMVTASSFRFVVWLPRPRPATTGT